MLNKYLSVPTEHQTLGSLQGYNSEQLNKVSVFLELTFLMGKTENK